MNAAAQIAEVPELVTLTLGGPVGVVVECRAGDQALVNKIAAHLAGDDDEGLESAVWSRGFAEAMRRLGARVVSEATGPTGEW